MSEKKYDFLEDIFETMSDKWYADDRAVELNDSIRRSVDYLTCLLALIDGHQETEKIQVDYTPFVAGYHYIVDHITTFSNIVKTIVNKYGDRAFTEEPELKNGLTELEYIDREYFFKSCAIDYVRGFLQDRCNVKTSNKMTDEQILKQSIFWVFRLLVICMFFMETSYVQDYFSEADADDFLTNFDN